MYTRIKNLRRPAKLPRSTKLHLPLPLHDSNKRWVFINVNLQSILKLFGAQIYLVTTKSLSKILPRQQWQERCGTETANTCKY